MRRVFPRYFVLMGFSSAITLLRGLVIAALLSPAEFGKYALVVALGIFSSSFLGWGSIERTNKRFPRLFAEGAGWRALSEADDICRLLAMRTSWSVGAVVVASLLWGWEIGLLVGSVALVAYGTAVQGVYTSIHRASGELGTIGKAFLFRSILAVCLAAWGAWLIGWIGAVIGEFIGALAGGVVSRAYANKSVAIAPASNVKAMIRQGDTGFWLFLAFLIASVPLYLDRLAVTTLLGASSAGTYGLLMLFVTASVTLCTIIVQKVGPQLVSLQYRGAATKKQFHVVAFWAAGVVICVLLGAISAAAVLDWWPGIVEQYELSNSLIIPTIILSALQVSMLLDWWLISNDQEVRILVSAGLFCLTWVTIIVLSHLLDWGLEGFLWGMALAKAVHVFSLAFSGWQIMRSAERRY